PSQRQSGGAVDDLRYRHFNYPPCVRIMAVCRCPIDHGASDDMQKAARLKVNEQKADARITEQVADRVEIIVARVVGDPQSRTIGRDMNEAARPAAMRGVIAVRPASCPGATSGADEKRIDVGDTRLLIGCQAV